MKKLRYSLAILSLLLMVNAGKSQGVLVKNILWGDELSKDIYVGVTNRFLVSPGDFDFILFDSAQITASRSGDTLTLFPHSTGKQKIYFQKNNETKWIQFDAHYLPDFYIGFNFKVTENVMDRKTVPDNAEIVLSSNRDKLLAGQLFITQYQIKIGEMNMTVKNSRLPPEALEEIRMGKPGDKVVVRCAEVKTNSNARLFLNIETAYTIR